VSSWCHVFLQGFRATLIPLLAVPVSLVAPSWSFPSGLLDQHALALRPGAGHRLVVDDAIVVVEAVEHHIEAGFSPREAAFKAMEAGLGPGVAIGPGPGARWFVPTASSRVSPGGMYQQFAVTIAVSVAHSAFNAAHAEPGALRAAAPDRSGTWRGAARRVLPAFNGWFARRDQRLRGRVRPF